jgi:hypothetical protein
MDGGATSWGIAICGAWQTLEDEVRREYAWTARQEAAMTEGCEMDMDELRRDYQAARCANPYCDRRANVKGGLCWTCASEQRREAEEIRIRRIVETGR